MTVLGASVLLVAVSRYNVKSFNFYICRRPVHNHSAVDVVFCCQVCTVCVWLSIADSCELLADRGLQICLQPYVIFYIQQSTTTCLCRTQSTLLLHVSFCAVSVHWQRLETFFSHSYRDILMWLYDIDYCHCCSFCLAFPVDLAIINII